MIVPSIVAFGTVFSGDFMFSAGILADSIPKKAYKVKAATTGNVAKSLSPVKLNTGKFSSLKKKTPRKIINTKGSIFKMVVITCILPEALTPLELSHVKNQINTRPVQTAANEFDSKIGKKKLKAPITAITIAALLIQIEIQ